MSTYNKILYGFSFLLAVGGSVTAWIAVWRYANRTGDHKPAFYGFSPFFIFKKELNKAEKKMLGIGIVCSFVGVVLFIFF